MIIDWFTIIAQIINFLILVWLLKRFLYKPILKAIEERETKITQKLLNAESIQAIAENTKDELEKKLKEFDDHRDDLMSKAILVVEVERDQLLNVAIKEIEQFKLKKSNEFESSEKLFHEKIVQQIYKEVFSLTRKILKDISGSDLESTIIDVFIQKINELDFKALKTDKSLKERKITVRSSSELVAKHKVLLEKVLHKNIDEHPNLSFEVVSDLFSGIELIFNGKKIAWSIGNYLDALESEVQKLLIHKVPE